MEIVQESVNEHSEDENEMNLLNTSKVQRRVKILDSDSENDETDKKDKNVREELSDNAEDSSLKNAPIKKRKRKRISMIDSDSDEDHVDLNKTDGNSEGEDNLKLSEESTAAIEDAVINSDEDVIDEEEVTPHNKSFPDEETAVEAVIYTTNNKGELIKESTSVAIKNSLSALCDLEDEEEEIIDKSIMKPHVYKPPRRKKNEEKQNKMTAQEAAKQRVEISAESQRMLRGSNVSLPYHKPKSYTIKEFLQKRSKLPSALPHIRKVPTSVAIKMSKEQLKEVSKISDERIKEVEDFYKSESEEEDEDDPSREIKSWLDSLVDNAVNLVEEKISVVRENKEIEEETLESSNQPESMEYEFTLDDVNENDSSKRTKFSELIKDKLDIQPKLSGTPDDIIDLEEGTTRISGVKLLVEKFFQHTAKKIPHKHKVELDVIGVGAGGEIIKETVCMNVDDEEEPPVVETPGAKLKKLREELELQMAQKRLELWKQKQEQGECLTVEKKIDEDPQTEKDILDDDEEEEYEMTESESEEEDEDEYDLQPEKPKAKSAFVDDEAEEDEEEEDCDEDIDGGANDSSDADVEEVAENEIFKSPQKKVLRRIVKPFSVDSDEDEDSQINEPTKVLKYYATDEDDVMTPNLPRVGKTPQRSQPEKSKPEFEFLTPVTYLTGLQNLNSDSKFSKDLPSSPICVPSQLLFSQEESSQFPVQKKLFLENLDESQSTQENVEDLAQLCSGVFPETQNCASQEKTEETQELPSTQDLLNLCSGDFTGVPLTTDIPQETEQPPEKLVVHVPSNLQEEIKNLDEENDQLISQLLDEDELERFKKKFESPINPPIRKTQILEDVEEVNATGLINSDDENEGFEVKMRKRKKLVFSDDEEEEEREDDDEPDEKEEEGEEEIGLHDEDDEEQQLENEIVAQGSHNFKITDFLDKEAELSESEWGSEDEDERGLDELEMEQGDEEKFNENKVRSELERIHMRQLLDDDNREVKILQELLLEDGEMHGTGRKRQFRWKTLDSADNGEFEKRDDDDIFLDEEENEEQFRKMRHKREMFLKKKSTTADDDDDSVLGDSQILKMGQQIFKNKSFSSQNNTPINNKPEEECKEPFNLLNKRGSFLSRKDQVLQRLAEYTKVTESVGTTAKNSKSFVFQTLQATETVVKFKDNSNKRKAPEGTPNAVKKLRLDDLSPAIGKGSTAKSSKAKKLFGNW